LTASGEHYPFDLNIRDFNLWMLEPMPVILILFDASKRAAYWLYVQQFFRDNPSRRPQKGAKTVRVRIPMKQKLNRRALRKMRAAKEEALIRSKLQVVSNV
jgi:hypothetical protein